MRESSGARTSAGVRRDRVPWLLTSWFSHGVSLRWTRIIVDLNRAIVGGKFEVEEPDRTLRTASASAADRDPCGEASPDADADRQLRKAAGKTHRKCRCRPGNACRSLDKPSAQPNNVSVGWVPSERAASLSSSHADLVGIAEPRSFPTATTGILRGRSPKMVVPCVYSLPGLAWGRPSPTQKARLAQQQRWRFLFALARPLLPSSSLCAAAICLHTLSQPHGRHRHHSGLVRVRARGPG